MVTVTRNFQITIPQEYRKKLKISVGDIIDWVPTEEGLLLIKKKESQSIKIKKKNNKRV